MSTLKTNSIAPLTNGDENYFLARAWANINGSGVASIRASGNISSLLDTGVGSYTLNYKFDLGQVDYAYFGNSDTTSASTSVHSFGGKANSNFKYTNKIMLESVHTNSILNRTAIDNDQLNIAVIGNLP